MLFGAEICGIKAPNYVVLAVLAIKEAYSQAQNLVLYDTPSNISKALYLVREAQKLFDDKEYRSLVDEVEELEPLAKSHIKQSIGFKDHNKKSASRAAEKKKIVLRWANEIIAEKLPHKISKKQIAITILKRIEKGKFLSNEIDIVKVKVAKDKNYPEKETGYKNPSVGNLENILTDL